MQQFDALAHRIVQAVAHHADQVEEHGRFRHGTHQGPLLVDGFNPETGAPTRWEENTLSNLACQQNHLRTLVGLSRLTGREQYITAARDWIGYAWERLRDPASDLLYWGGHTTYCLEQDRPLVGNHEMKCVYPFYRFMYAVDEDSCCRFITALWHKHVHDWHTLLFNRHGEYEDWDRASAWQSGFRGGPVPIIENRMLSFVNTGSDLICAAVMLHVLSGNQAALEWALRLLQRYEDIRDPHTGLAGYQFNHRDPCRVRMSFLPPLSERSDVNETTVITNGVIHTRYGRAGLAWLNMAEELGPEAGRPFLELVVRDLRALARFSYDAQGGRFMPVLHDGQILLPEMAQEGVGYCPPGKLQPVPASGPLFLAYARAYRLTQEPDLLDMARNLACDMGWAWREGHSLTIASPADRSSGQSSGRYQIQDAASVIMGLLDLYRADGDHACLAGACALGDAMLEAGRDQGLLIFGDRRTHGCVSVDAQLPPVLLQLAACATDETVALPRYYPNSTSFDPKVIVARRH